MEFSTMEFSRICIKQSVKELNGTAVEPRKLTLLTSAETISFNF